jgi:uncharacterized membrane protein YhaH (DUF805 family)
MTRLTAQTRRRIGASAWATAWFGLVLGQLHALSRHQTVDGREDLELAATRFWSDPAREVLRPLLDWADPDTVYLTYGKLWIPVFACLTACAYVCLRDRAPRGFERVAWWAALTTYVAATLSVIAYYGLQWNGFNAVEGPAEILMFTSLPLLVLTSTVLGITLLVKRFRPRAAAWLLALVIPLMIGITEVTSLGSGILPVAFAFALLGRRMARPSTVGPWPTGTADDHVVQPSGQVGSSPSGS